MSISVKHITKLYGEQKALNDVSFDVDQGAVVGFLGPNGAGKSTLMKILTCYIPQTSGTATVCGFDVEKQSMDVRRSVGYLPEHNPLYLDMYVKEYLEFIAGLHKIANKKSRIKEMINLVGLDIEQNKKIGALSKGYRQRVGLAQAMIHDPQVLILDEPTSGLDPNQIIEIRNLIRNIGSEKTVMMSTHIMQEVEAVCDSVIIINRGDIVANDSAENVKNYSQQAQFIIVEFSEEVNKENLTGIRGVDTAEHIKGFIWKLKASSDLDIRKEVFDFAVQQNISVLTMQKQEQRMEDVFKELTSK